VYFLSSIYYYYTQTHLFDPFLQAHPPELNFDMLEKPKDTFRIITLGGSTTYNPRLPEDKRYPNVLEELLKKNYPELNIEVFNAGMDWYTTKHSLINYVTYLRDWQPNLVIVMHAINDLCRSFSPPSYAVGPYNRSWSHFYGPSIRGAKPPAFEKRILEKLFDKWFYTLKNRERTISLDSYISLEDFERHLRYLIHYIKSDNVKIILMTQPYIYKDQMSTEELSVLWFGSTYCKQKFNFFQYQYSSPSSLRVAMEAFNNVTRELSLEEELILVDLETQIRKDLVNFSDDVHYTVEGARQVAEIVAKRIIEEKLIIGNISSSDKQLTVLSSLP
jgi:lysophospholipase L1-like esterase